MKRWLWLAGLVWLSIPALGDVPSKLVGDPNDPNATYRAVRNVFGPRADRLIALYAGTETTGATTLANLGCGQAYGNTWPAWGAATITGTPTFVATDPNTASANCPYVEFTDGTYATLWSLADPNTPETLTRGTLLVRCRPNSSVGISYVANSGGVVEGVLTLRRLATGPVAKIEINGAFDQSFSVGGDLEWHTWAIRWGPSGTAGGIDRWDTADPNYTIVDPNATTPVVISAAGSLRIAGNASGNTKTTDIAICAIWDIDLSDRELADLMADPYLPARPPPNRNTEFSTIAAARVGCMTGTTAQVRRVTGYGAAADPNDPNAVDPSERPAGLGVGQLASATVSHRVRYAASRWDVWSETPAVVTVNGATAVTTPVTHTLSGLSAGTEYWYATEWADDPNGTWYPFPVALGRFVTQRTTGTSGSCAIFSDDHTGSVPIVAGLNDPVELGFGVSLARADLPADAGRRFSTWQAEHDLYSAASLPDFVVDLGDTEYNDLGEGTDDVFTTFLKRYAEVGHVRWQSVATAGGYKVLAGHEGEGWGTGYSADAATQKQATLARKRFWPNPVGPYPDPNHATYSEGGEAEGVPTTSSTLSWQPALGSADPEDPNWLFDATWRTAYQIDDANDALGAENASPLGNYYAFTWADCLFVVLDHTRYAQVGNNATDFTFGDVQLSWLESTLAGSDAQWKVILCHTLVRGDDAVGLYWRGSGRLAGLLSAEELTVHNLLRTYGVTAYIKGHDHTFAHVVYQGVNYITVPSESATMFGNYTSGQADVSYGTRDSRGADLPGEDPNSGTAAGILSHLHVPGYVRIDWTDATFSVAMRQTSFMFTTVSGVTFGIEHAHSWGGSSAGARWIAEPVAASGAAATLTERPTDVLFVIPETVYAGLADPWYDTANINNSPSAVPAGYNYALADPPGDYLFDQDWDGSAITLDPNTPDGNVRIAAVPATVYTANLTNADPPEGACCAADGSCTVVADADCDGTWQGADTLCEPNPCPQPPTGACCVSGVCSVTTEAGCAGTWDEGTPCVPNPCTGACCRGDGSCSATVQADCTGVWKAADCDPNNPCPQPAAGGGAIGLGRLGLGF